jgi:hypothetical protein
MPKAGTSAIKIMAARGGNIMVDHVRTFSEHVPMQRAQVSPAIEENCAGGDTVVLNAGLSSKEHDQIQAITMLRKHPPAIGSMEGQAHGAPVHLTYDRRQWTVKGETNGSTVDLSIDHDKGTISGDAQGKTMDIDFTWSPEKISMRDDSNGLLMNLDWNKGKLEGKLWGKPLDIRFDMNKGTIKDMSGRDDVDLTYDKISGVLTGTLDGSDAKVTMTNLDIYDFLNHYYAFAK